MHLTTPRAIIKNYFNGIEFVKLTFMTLHNRAEEVWSHCRTQMLEFDIGVKRSNFTKRSQKCVLYKTPEAAAFKTERGFLPLGVCKAHSRQLGALQCSHAFHSLTVFSHFIKFRSLSSHFAACTTHPPRHWYQIIYKQNHQPSAALS